MSGMECDRARRLLRDYQEGRLDAESARELEAHVGECGDCRQIEAEERVVSELLRERLPRFEAPATLKQRLAALTHGGARAPERRAQPAPRAPMRPRARHWLAAAALAAVATVAWLSASRSDERATLVNEAVNDHLRVLYAERPLEVESGGIHQVRPWFSGRLDFAPDIAFSGDDEFPLVGGAVGYFIDRKAAIFLYKRRLHTISLLVFRAAGLPWPGGAAGTLGCPHGWAGSARGFRWQLWCRDDLGYALVSDTEASTLARLAKKLGAPR